MVAKCGSCFLVAGLIAADIKMGEWIVEASKFGGAFCLKNQSEKEKEKERDKRQRDGFLWLWVSMSLW
jgi:hypothetical protein